MGKKTSAPAAAPAVAPAAPAAPTLNPEAVAAATAAAPKEAGKIQKLIIMSKAGWTNKQLIAHGFNKSTVAIQTSARKKDPAGYDQKHAILDFEKIFKAPVPPVDVPAPAVSAAPAAVVDAPAPSDPGKDPDGPEI